MSTYLWWRDNLPRPRPYSAKQINRTEAVANYLSSYSDQDCIDDYRLDKEGIYFFSEKLRTSTELSRSTAAGLPIEGQLMVALRYYATGNSINSLKKTASLDLSVGTVYQCVVNVSTALARLGNEFVKYPRDDKEITGIKTGFFEYGGSQLLLVLLTGQ